MSHDHSPSDRSSYALSMLLALLGLYAVAAMIGWPQQATQALVAAHEEHEAHGHDESAPPQLHHQENEPVDPATSPADLLEPPPTADDADQADESGWRARPHDEPLASPSSTRPPLWTVAPFVALLGGIALLPLFRFTERWWESNLHRLYVAAFLGVVTLAYYAVAHQATVAAHWPYHFDVVPDPGAWVQWKLPLAVAGNALLDEYIPFIVLLFSLYTLSGGVRVEGDLRPRPFTNAIFIGLGGLLASFIGTTGAAMLLIRPLLEANRNRAYKTHTVVIFIFVVCNCGGLLLPLGDPPLFLGYLRGVPFFWTLKLWMPWLLVNGLLLLIYWTWDRLYFWPREAKDQLGLDQPKTRPFRIEGLPLHVPLLLGVIFSVATLSPGKEFFNAGWHPWMYLREAVQLGMVALSLMFGARSIRARNQFNYHAITEVAVLFIGIFLCMQPALQILEVEGQRLGLQTPRQFFWATGGLSAVLDNAPTYVVFFQTAVGLPGGDVAVTGGAIYEPLLIAVSLGAVFMGAMTYIGNGPNFMVKAIAETSGVRMPSFFGYLKYSFGILLPVLILCVLIFL